MNLRQVLLSIVLIVVCCGAVYLLLPAALDYRQTKVEIEQMRADLAVHEEETRELRREIEALRTNYQFVERVAREKFGLCGEGEVIYHFDPPAGEAAPPPPVPAPAPR